MSSSLEKHWIVTLMHAKYYSCSSLKVLSFFCWTLKKDEKIYKHIINRVSMVGSYVKLLSPFIFFSLPRSPISWECEMAHHVKPNRAISFSACFWDQRLCPLWVLWFLKYYFFLPWLLFCLVDYFNDNQEWEEMPEIV